ncbi:MAG: hypothetical protein HPY70_05505 [Firmicutes bacterium]|nr:hypothetical protein [Bacillota bacterium]
MTNVTLAKSYLEKAKVRLKIVEFLIIFGDFIGNNILSVKKQPIKRR